ncbi:MAG: alpha/beta fold hydrolase [Clostridia bacterium]|nr:alpha/beta fold hydrolase [Clostridia bacterium]
MKKSFKKSVCIVLSVLMMLSALSSVAFAADEEKLTPVVFVDGIMSSDIVYAETGENAFVPSTDDIVNAVKDLIVPLGKSIGNGDYSELGEPLSEALVKIFDGIACDENGKPVYNTVSNYSIPTEEEILSGKIAKECKNLGFDAEEVVHFSYDWRLDMVTIASLLHDCIEAVLEATGAEKVNIVGFSMGTCVVTTYLHEHGYEYVDGVVMLSGGFNGVSTCGEPFSGQIMFDETGLVTYLKTMLGDDVSASMINVLFDALSKAGVLGNILSIAEEMNYAILDDVFELGLGTTFARMAGIWALIGQDDYEKAKELLIGDNVSDEFIAKIDYYHYEIQANNEEILDGVIENGGNLAIIAKYGSTIPPVCESQLNIGDSVIDTVNTSFGATCATADTTLGEDYVQAVDCGHDHISADNMIDASTCVYPEYTWFIKDLMHSDHTQAQWELISFIFESETQPTVCDNENYSQFLINVDEEIVPLTEHNNSDIYASAQKTFFEKIYDFLRTFWEILMSFINVF